MKFYLNHVATSINGKNKVESITIEDRQSGEEKTIPVQGVFIYVGLIPMTGFLKGHIELDKWGYIVAGEDTKTSAPGVFAAGDVRQKRLQQITTAVGDGATAAFMAERHLEELTAG
jgi:thioredoxin reductase (NADPH)